MRIALDIRYRTRSGAASYIDNIVPALTRSRSGHEFVVLLGDWQSLPPGTQCESIALHNASAASQAIHDQVQLPGILRRLGADVYHPLKHLGTLYPPCAQVTTAHSITLPFRGEFPISRREEIYWKLMGTRMFRRSQAVIAVSEFVREFLIEVIGIPAGRISVVHHGIDARFRPLNPNERSRASDDAPYLLTVGNIFPVKNFVMAVRVLAALAPEYPTLRLKMAGATHHPYVEEVKAEARAAGILDRLDFLGFTSPDRLVHVMNDAELILMPSLTEGCPVTLLEAMACGVAVVASGRGGIPEVGGSAVRIVTDPSDRPGWIAATSGVLADADERHRLRSDARRRAELFTWERAVTETLRVYDSLTAIARG
jgi:glycosyltransferase involved in cell wall biosynthesis